MTGQLPRRGTAPTLPLGLVQLAEAPGGDVNKVRTDLYNRGVAVTEAELRGEFECAAAEARR
jgi:hypothetical protein